MTEDDEKTTEVLNEEGEESPASEEEIQRLKEQTSKGKRTHSADTSIELKEKTMQRQFEKIEDGELSKTISVRDEFIAALLHAAEENEEIREQLVAGLEAELDKEIEYNRSEVLRLAIRHAMMNAEGRLWNLLGTAYTEHQISNP